MTKSKVLMLATLAASFSVSCTGHRVLTARGIASPVLLGPVQALDAGASNPEEPSGEPVTMIELEQVLTVPVGDNQTMRAQNEKNAEATLAVLRKSSNAHIVVRDLHCKAFMSLFVRSTWCKADGALIFAD
jgi:hypothetical protein